MKVLLAPSARSAPRRVAYFGNHEDKVSSSMGWGDQSLGGGRILVQLSQWPLSRLPDGLFAFGPAL